MIEANNFHGNQLLFNLYNGAAPTTMSAKFQAPKPIVIENLAISSTPPRGQGGRNAGAQQFTAISAESLSRAMELAKRDIKARNHEVRGSSPTRGRSHLRATKIIRSRSYQDKLKKRQQRSSPVLVVKERQSVKPSRTAVVQTERVATSSSNAVKKRNLVDLPVRSMSPPTRDVPMTHEDKVLNEICRLRTEMTRCLRQIQTIKEQKDQQRNANNNKTQVFTEDAEEMRKRKIRAEERATRSARTIYMLMQEANRLYDEIKKLDKAKIESKKSALTSRLAALHRNVVRALQLLLPQMSDDDTLRSVMRDYRDLAVIIRQLSFCCAQLEVTSESTSAQDDLLNLLKDVVELNEIVERVEPASSSSRLCQSTHEYHHKKPSHVHAPVRKSNPMPHHNRIEQVKVTLEGLGAKSGAIESRMQPFVFDDRATVLRSGITRLLENNAIQSAPAAKMKAAQKKNKRLKFYHDPRSYSRRGVLINHQAKGLPHRCEHCACSSARDLPPSSCQHCTKPTVSTNQKRSSFKARHRSQSPRARVRPLSAGETSWHFAEPTFSKAQKEIAASRDWSRCSTPPSPRPRSQASANDASWRFAEPTFSKSQKEVNRGRDESYVSSRSVSPTSAPRRVRISNGSAVAGDASWRKQMESDLRARIEPVLKNGQVSTDLNKVTDEIIGELMEDMASELHHRREDNRANYHAAVIRDTPDVQTILTRLRQMELEQDEIRRRWNSLAYDEAKSGTKATINNKPGSPIPVEIIAGASQPSGKPVERQKLNVYDSNEPIIFTKPHVKSTIRQTDFQIDKSVRQSGIVVSLQPEALENIHQQVESYDSFLRRHVNDRVEHFDPWKVVETISDDILESCLLDVCKELEDINNDIVDHVYRTEFAMVPGTGSLS